MFQEENQNVNTTGTPEQPVETQTPQATEVPQTPTETPSPEAPKVEEVAAPITPPVQETETQQPESCCGSCQEADQPASSGKNTKWLIIGGIVIIAAIVIYIVLR